MENQPHWHLIAYQFILIASIKGWNFGCIQSTLNVEIAGATRRDTEKG